MLKCQYNLYIIELLQGVLFARGVCLPNQLINKIKLRRFAKRFVQRASCYKEHGGQAYTYTPPV